MISFCSISVTKAIVNTLDTQTMLSEKRKCAYLLSLVSDSCKHIVATAHWDMYLNIVKRRLMIKVIIQAISSDSQYFEGDYYII